MADTTTELEVLDQIVDVLGGTSGQYETVVPVLQQIKELLASGITDPESIAEAVAAWLDEHPEATTTVQDGSITGVKIADDTIPDAKLVQTGGVLERVNTISTPVTIDLLNTILKGFINIDGTLASGYFRAPVSVAEGESISIKCETGSSIMAYVLVDQSDTVVDYYQTADAWGTLHNYDITITVPATGTLYVNSIHSWYVGVRRNVIVPSNQGEVDTLSAKVDELDTVIDVVYPTNLYDGQYLDGYMTTNGVLGEGDASKYAHMKPTLLKAGDYLFKSRSMVFGTSTGRGVYVVTRGDSYIDKIVPTVLVEDSVDGNDLCKFTLAEPTYVTINVGGVRHNGLIPAYSEDTFMLVTGSTADDWPASYVSGFVPQSGYMTALMNGCGGLVRKIAIFDGDSIGQGSSVGSTDPTYGYGYAGRIGEANTMTWHNYSISGGIISSASTEGLSGRHSVLDNIDTMYADFPNADYIIFEGGTNDADLIGNAIEDPTILGTLDASDFTGPFDTSTFTGALDTIFSKAISYWKGKHIGFVIAQKMGRYSNFDAEHSNRRAYFERVMQVCNKWGIPYLNLWDGCYLNPRNPSCYDSTMTTDQNIAAGNLYTDWQHLTAKGYDYISPIVQEWMKTL